LSPTASPSWISEQPMPRPSCTRSSPPSAAFGKAYWANSGNHAIAWRIDGTEFDDPASAIYAAFNGWSGEVSFTLPPVGDGRSWHRVTDTCNWAEGPDNVAAPGAETRIGGAGASYTLCGRAVLLLIAN
jgi:glycogen operon protein